MIPHIYTLFEFISIQYENQHQILYKENWTGPNQASRVFIYVYGTLCIAMHNTIDKFDTAFSNSFYTHKKKYV